MNDKDIVNDDLNDDDDDDDNDDDDSRLMIYEKKNRKLYPFLSRYRIVIVFFFSIFDVLILCC